MRLVDADAVIARLDEMERKAAREGNKDLRCVCAGLKIYIDGLPTEDRWYRRGEREPTEADTDEAKCLMTVHRYNGIMLTHIANYYQNKLYTHWRPAIALPEDHRAGQ